ncbi:tetratricopeptide repeat protein [Primorskyibacter aestuariivivens]|uniref:tetratricopeptide repeat protein n=1 Tax=Primorskyibacter aestuariivivens TaxID=1888912 RepID=UPI0023017887|nr:tetratricopeptide repeat protein [Primorskyibacter aestuariivivens]MDA7430550.1 tetratricopeptide repeat protein [Primorskyibacter aestuariivivens]
MYFVFPNFQTRTLTPHLSRLRLNVAMLALLGALATGVAEAQTSSAPDIRQADAMLWDTPTPEVIADARATLEDAAASGDVHAQYLLGRHLLNGWVLAQDKPRGLQLLNASAEAGHAPALTELGKAYLFGLTVPSDPARAADYLEQASAKEDAAAMRVLGEQLVSGDLLARDVDRGTALLESAIASGDIDAHVALGKLYLYGIGVREDQDKALALFETAAEAGNGHGLAAYGDALMWSERNPRLAEAILNRAGEMQAHEAWVSLAHGAMYGYLGGGRTSRAKYQGYADRAREAGADKIAVLEAERRMWGINMRASGPETLDGLRRAAEAGNARAAGYLIELMRDGNGLNVRRRPVQAREALAEFGALFSETRRDQYALSIDAALARQVQDYAPVADAFNARPELHSTWFGTQIAEANLNIAFYILQAQLASEGRYGGSINGYATRKTLLAAARKCRDMELDPYCNDNVLRPGVVGALLTR